MSGSYRFRLGSFECFALSDGDRDYPLKNLFADVPLAEAQEALRQRRLPIDFVTTPYTHLYANTGEHRVLVGMGAGRFSTPRTGKLLRSMEAAGIDPAQIDTVLMTHAHPDHIGGALDSKGRRVYANARHYLSKEEWGFWFSGASLAKAPERFVRFARSVLKPLQDRMHLIEGEAEVVPGVRAIPAPGHTPGHIVVELRAAGESLLYVGDTVIHPLHMEHPDWHPIYDILPEEAAASKQRIFDGAAAQKALVMGQHFAPFPSLGTVVKKEVGWRWEPIELASTHQS
jgi:glyoxylase-like metal-dependent hydrolase (beta-lactamase superfamily II)